MNQFSNATNLSTPRFEPITFINLLSVRRLYSFFNPNNSNFAGMAYDKQRHTFSDKQLVVCFQHFTINNKCLASSSRLISAFLCSFRLFFFHLLSNQWSPVCPIDVWSMSHYSKMSWFLSDLVSLQIDDKTLGDHTGERCWWQSLFVLNTFIPILDPRNM